MIDAGLPLVQCLDILADPDREQVASRKVLAQRQEQRRAGRDVLRRARASTQGLRRALRQPGRRRRGRRHPRHHPEPPRDLHREGGQAASARSRARWSTRSASSCVAIGVDRRDARSRSSRCSRTCTRSSAARKLPGADPDRHRPLARASSTTGTSSSARWSASSFGIDRCCDEPQGGAEPFDRVLLRMPVIGPVLRKIVVARFTRTLGTLLVLGRADPRRARDLRQDRRQHASSRTASCTRAAKISEGKDMAGPLAETERVPADGRADDRRRRADRRDGPDAPEDRRLLRGRGRRRGRRA